MAKLRYIDFGKLDPTNHVALHEWNLRTPHDSLTILTHTTSKLIVMANILPIEEEFGELPEGLPIRRFYIPRRSPGSALFADGTLAIHFTHPIMDLQQCRDAFSATLLRTVRGFGIQAYTRSNTNDYYVEVDGKEKKFSGHYMMMGAGQARVGATISFDFDAQLANRIFNLKSDKIKKKGDVTDMAQIVVGLHDLVPGLTATDMAEVFVSELAQRFGTTVERSALSQQERNGWRAIGRVVNRKDWILGAVCPKELQSPAS